MALGNHLSFERIRVFGLAASSLLAHIKSPVIAQANRQPRATNDRSDYAKTEGVPLMLTWLEEKHKIKRKLRSWRKLHLGLDLVSGQIVCSYLTTDDIGDPSALPGLLEQIDGPVEKFLADGAYDGEPTCVVLTERFGSAIEVTIPPPKNAVLSHDAAGNPSARDCHVAGIGAHGRMAWQRSSGYNQRSRAETLMGRWKTVIGPKLKARAFQNQKTEIRIAVRILNRMTELGRPSFERTA